MPAITKKHTWLKLQFVANTDQSIHAGLVAVEAMARRFDLWNKLRRLSCLDPRKDKRRGYGPEVIIGQLIYALCSGGGCLSDSEALNDDPLARELFGVGKFADQSQVGQWLREQSEESVAALRRLLHEFVAWVWQQADRRRRLHAGQREVFFDDTQLARVFPPGRARSSVAQTASLLDRGFPTRRPLVRRRPPADWKSAIGSLVPARSALRALPSLRSGNPFRRCHSGSSQQVGNLRYEPRARRSTTGATWRSRGRRSGWGRCSATAMWAVPRT